MSSPYEDIIGLPHHVSGVHPPMPMSSRAAQFAPFAALTGHDSAIMETARLTEEDRELSESEAEVLDRKLSCLRMAEDSPVVTVGYFVPDGRKAGGSCHTVTGPVKRVDPEKGVLQLVGGPDIPICCIRAIDGVCFMD